MPETPHASTICRQSFAHRRIQGAAKGRALGPFNVFVSLGDMDGGDFTSSEAFGSA
jgi:hypothetical protein